MTDYAAELESELEVLTSIFPTELNIISPTSLSILTTPSDSSDDPAVSLNLTVEFGPTYPDEVPTILLEAVDGEVTEEEEADLLRSLGTVAEESLGMAMVYTLYEQLRELLVALLAERERVISEKEALAAQAADEEEAKRTKGTPVTPASFAVWKTQFEAEMKVKRARDEEARIRALPPKEREDVRKVLGKLTGRALFEKDILKIGDDELDEGGESVDVSKYERREGLGDSDSEDEADGVAGLQLSDDD